VTGRKKTPAQLDREIAEAIGGCRECAHGSRGHSHATKLDRDDARRFGRDAYRMERTKAQARSDARSEGFGAWQLDAVEEGWDAERRDTRGGGFAGTSHATRRKARSHAAKKISGTLFAVEIDSREFDRGRALPSDAVWRGDLVHLAEAELARGRSYRRPKDARYAVIEWTGYRAGVGHLLEWLEASPGITRYAEIFE